MQFRFEGLVLLVLALKSQKDDRSKPGSARLPLFREEGFSGGRVSGRKLKDLGTRVNVSYRRQSRDV